MHFLLKLLKSNLVDKKELIKAGVITRQYCKHAEYRTKADKYEDISLKKLKEILRSNPSKAGKITSLLKEHLDNCI